MRYEPHTNSGTIVFDCKAKQLLRRVGFVDTDTKEYKFYSAPLRIDKGLIQHKMGKFERLTEVAIDVPRKEDPLSVVRMCVLLLDADQDRLASYDAAWLTAELAR